MNMTMTTKETNTIIFFSKYVGVDKSHRLRNYDAMSIFSKVMNFNSIHEVTFNPQVTLTLAISIDIVAALKSTFLINI